MGPCRELCAGWEAGRGVTGPVLVQSWGLSEAPAHSLVSRGPRCPQ